MATTYRNKESKFWYARFTDRTGKRVSRSTKSESRREAKRISEDMESAERKVVKSDPETPQMIFQTIRIAEMELQRGTLTTARAEELIRQMLRAANPNAVDSSFRRFAGAWLDRIEGDVTEHTWTGYSNAIKLALTALGTKGEGSLHKLTVGDMEAVQAAMAVGRRGKTANDYMTVIRRILESAVEKDLIQKNPSRAIKLRSKSDSRTHAPFTVAEVRKLLEHAQSEEWKGLITLAAHTGLRCGDLRRLRSENIIGTAITLQPSKTTESTGVILKIPLSPPCLAWVAGLQGDLFPTLKAVKDSSVSAMFSKIMRAAGVAQTVELVAGDKPVVALRSFHSLRHTFSSWLAEADIHADVRQKLTGHSSASVHAIYSHHDEALARAVGTLPNI